MKEKCERWRGNLMDAGKM
jgi:hypothetical protein